MSVEFNNENELNTLKNLFRSGTGWGGGLKNFINTHFGVNNIFGSASMLDVGTNANNIPEITDGSIDDAIIKEATISEKGLVKVSNELSQLDSLPLNIPTMMILAQLSRQISESITSNKIKITNLSILPGDEDIVLTKPGFIIFGSGGGGGSGNDPQFPQVPRFGEGFGFSTVVGGGGVGVQGGRPNYIQPNSTRAITDTTASFRSRGFDFETVLRFEGFGAQGGFAGPEGIPGQNGGLLIGYAPRPLFFHLFKLGEGAGLPGSSASDGGGGGGNGDKAFYLFLEIG